MDTPNEVHQCAHRKPSFKRVWRLCKRVILPLVIVILFPIPILVFFVTGIFDVSRNTPFRWDTIQRYFVGNGILTWILSPINLLFDLLCLPYRNKGIYRLHELPSSYVEEIESLVRTAEANDISAKVSEQLRGESRGMMMFKWYGKNLDTSIDVPDYHKKFNYIQTIGVSIFNKRRSTNLHFGPIRATLRVLCCINDFRSREAYIDVGDHRHYWADDKFFIFDDTLQHQSVNESDQLRVCLFVDIVRPAPFPALLRLCVVMIEKASWPFRQLFYKNWSFLK